MRDDVVFQEGSDGGLYGTGGGEVVFLNEGGGGDVVGLSLFGDGLEEEFLLRGEAGEHVLVAAFLGLDDVGPGGLPEVCRAGSAGGGEGEQFVHHHLEEPRAAVELAVYRFNQGAFHLFALFFEQPQGEVGVGVEGDGFQPHADGALVEGFGGGVEHVAHDVPFASGEDELGLLALLDFAAQQGFHVFLFVGADLLEFIDGDEAGFVGCFEVVEDFVQRGLRGVDVAQADVETGFAGDAVQFEADAQGAHHLEEAFGQEGFAGFEFFVDGFAQQVDEFRQGGGGIDVYKKGVVFFRPFPLVEAVPD